METKGNTALSAGARTRKYFKELRSEFNKVIWPTPRQTVTYTGFVVALSVLVALLIMGMDAVFNLGLNQFIR